MCQVWQLDRARPGEQHTGRPADVEAVIIGSSASSTAHRSTISRASTAARAAGSLTAEASFAAATSARCSASADVNVNAVQSAHAGLLAREIIERWAVELALLPMITASTSAGRPVCCSPGLARSSCHTWHTEPFPPPRPEPTEPEAPHENSGSHEGAATSSDAADADPGTPRSVRGIQRGEEVCFTPTTAKKRACGGRLRVGVTEREPCTPLQIGDLLRVEGSPGDHRAVQSRRDVGFFGSEILIRLPDRAAPTQVPTI